MTMNWPNLLETIIGHVERASDLVKAMYEGDGVRVDFKSPGDPVTDADRAANTLLCDALAKLLPEAALVGEESTGEAIGDRSRASMAIFIDPLDGTRDFVDRTGQFAVMVGLVVDNVATLGVVKEPVTGRLFAAAPSVRAFEQHPGSSRKPLDVSARTALRDATVILSRTRPSPPLDALLLRSNMTSIRMGSAGVKGTRVASGEIDAFVHLGMSGCLWDSAAIDAILRAAGGILTDARGSLVDYRKPRYENDRGIIAANTALHALLVEAIASDADCVRYNGGPSA